MTTLNGVILAALAGAATTLGGAANAADEAGAYLGFSAGSTGADFRNASGLYPSSLVPPVTTTKDKNSAALRVSAGYRFTQNFAIEGGLGGLGKFRVTDRVGSDSVKNELTVGALTIDALGAVALSDSWSVYAGVGFGIMAVTSKPIVGGAATLSPAQGASRSETNIAPHARVGFAYAIDPRWSLRLDVDGYKGVGTKGGRKPTGRGDANSMTFGVNYRF